ncbi:valine--tRNA ligase [Candidatus Saganbacteria bacterium]|nr:valine--tRNA ligase [Candidatus Saganbacteria bacterium]
MVDNISKVYDPTEVEQKWYKIWEESGLFKPEEDSAKLSFTIVIPPPNVTGSLHMGHALNNSIQDLLIRYKRMNGFNALWIPGTDHAGIATQNVVERELKKEGKTKDDLGREKFIAKVWEWKKEYGGRITQQLRRLGASCDWSRERFTMDEGLSKAVRRHFVQLYNEGLIYRGKRIINWCPRCQTALSDIEVEHENKKSHLWHLKYGPLIVATTRPETMLGDTAVAVKPHDERYKHLWEKTIELPLVGRQIPIIKDDFVDIAFGTGAVKVTPAHDPNDYEMGQRHNLPMINVLTPDGKITLQEFSAEGKEKLKELEGLDRFKARERIVQRLEEQGLLVKIENYETSIGHCYRCKTIIEPYLSDQWFVRVGPLAEKGVAAVEEGQIKFVPDRWTKVYLQWMTNLRDWCISRQLWWGHQIPAYYCKSEIRNPKSEINSKSEIQNTKLCEEIIVSETKPEKCPKCGGTEIVQDPDVFDTWFSSALWPFSTLGWPDETPDLKTFYPTDVLVTSYDIISFWVARMIMAGLHFMKQEPFHTVYIHGLVKDIHGKKMSKSWGNVIDPLEVINKAGADALRFAFLSLIAGQGQDVKLSEDRITEARNFANKIWNASRFVLMNTPSSFLPLIKGENVERSETSGGETLADQWILARLNQTIADVSRNIETYEFGQAAHQLYDFIWGDFCDWYIEMSKSDLYSDDKKRKEQAIKVLIYVLEKTLRLLHPFMPFITEEIWQTLLSTNLLSTDDKMPCLPARRPVWAGRNKRIETINDQKPFLMKQAWPTVEKQKESESLAAVEYLKALITAIRNIKANYSLQTKEVDLVLCPSVKEKAYLLAGQGYIKQLAKVAKIEIVDTIETPKQSSSLIVGETQGFVPLKGLIDVEKETARLKKEQDNVVGSLERLKQLLVSPDFLAKAPPEAVAKQKVAQQELEDKLKIVSARMKELSSSFYLFI